MQSPLPVPVGREGGGCESVIPKKIASRVEIRGTGEIKIVLNRSKTAVVGIRVHNSILLYNISQY